MMTMTMMMMMFTTSMAANTETTHTNNNSNSNITDSTSHGTETQHEPEPALAVLFPWFSEIMGIVIFYLLARFWKSLPYTAALFIVGVAMGIGSHKLGRTDQLTESILMWSEIDSEVLLLVFLPGLIFRDAFSLNVHLFLEAISQISIFAFPMVLAGTTLTALVAYYIFPYGWSFNLCMTFGSILAATDPVAVASLLDEVGAPPRLKIHVAGESLLNDGSAVVFFSIFAGSFLLELGIEGIGTDVTISSGIEMFFRMALGGACIGVAFGIGLVQILSMFKRRLSQEENVVEVTASIAVAYLCYFVAEVTCGTSGVLATVFCGVTTKAFGQSLVNDPELLDNFWVLVEHLLNSLIFVLGGTVWGTIISQPDNRDGHFSDRDWGYLVILYLLVTIIRYVLFFAVFPITSRIGLKTNWQETFFSCYGGLRGAVGIALALALDNRVIAATDSGSVYREQTTRVFGMVGGIAFLTLVINGITAGPVLRALGLARETATRKKILQNFKKHFRMCHLDHMVRLLAQRRFRHVDFAIIRHHVKELSDLTRDELDVAVRRHKLSVPESRYVAPALEHVYPYLDRCSEEEHIEHVRVRGKLSRLHSNLPMIEFDDEEGGEQGGEVAAVVDDDDDDEGLSKDEETGRSNPDDVDDVDGMELDESAQDMMTEEACKEFRLVFVSLLRAAYQEQVKNGELAEGEGFLSFILFQSLDFAADEINNGGEVNDWSHTQVIPSSIKTRAHDGLRKIKTRLKSRKESDEEKKEPEHTALQFNLHRALAVLSAHVWAQEKFRAEFESEFPAIEHMVIRESNRQIEQAEAVLLKKNHDNVDTLVSHIFCSILLNNAADEIISLGKVGLLKATEAEEMLEEIEEELGHVHHCPLYLHPGEIKREREVEEHRFY